MPRLPKVDPERALNGQLAEIAQVLPADFLRNLAKSTKFAERIKKIDPALLVWNLVFGYGTSMQRTLADLKRRYCTISDESLAPSSFFDRFNERLVAFLEGILQHLLGQSVQSVTPSKILSAFKDVLIFDSTIVRLLDSLSNIFPGAGMPAGVKIASVLSVARASLKSLRIYPGTKADVKTFRLDPEIRDHLLLFDLGYFKYAIMEKIGTLGGFFISRLHGNADPTIIAVNQSCRGRAIDPVGKKLRECLPLLKRDVLNLMVEVEVARRVYRGKKTIKTMAIRLVGILNEETEEYHLYLTNLGCQEFPPAKIAELYRGRWFIELMFKELKSRYALDVISTGKPEIVKALIYCAMITLVISRRLFIGYRDAMTRGGIKISQERWAKFLVLHAEAFLRELLKRAEIPFSESILWNLALRETEDPTPDRERLEDIWNAQSVDQFSCSTLIRIQMLKIGRPPRRPPSIWG